MRTFFVFVALLISIVSHSAVPDIAVDDIKIETSLKESLSEENIPVKLTNSEVKTNVAASGTDKMIMSMALILVLIGASFIYVKKRSLKGNSLQNKTQIKILSQTYLAPKKSLVLVRVAGESILVGVGDQNINLIKSLSLLDEDVEEKITEDFNATLDKVDESTDQVKEKITLSTAATSSRKQSFSSEDDFSHKGIKELISDRLKSMRSIN